MKRELEKVISGGSLSKVEAEQVMDRIMTGEVTASQIAGFLTALRMKGETVEEIAGLVSSMRKHALQMIPAEAGVIDTCGTGGSGISKFNVSTTAAFVSAAAGVPIAKHGNGAMSGKSGSSDVLRALGVHIELSPIQAGNCLSEAGICFMFAPLYHQSMKYATGPRKELGFKTVFNILGPLTNPAGAKRQVIGTYSSTLLKKMALVLQLLGSEHVMVVHGGDGLDEITVTDVTHVVELKDNKIKEYQINPEILGISYHTPTEIAGGSPEYNATIVTRVLSGEIGAYRDIVIANAAASLYVGGKALNLQEGVTLAKQLIDSGKALSVLHRLIEVSNRYKKELA